MVADVLLDSFPLSRYDPSVTEVLREIDEYQKLEADWDSEGALPMSPEAARLAAWLVQLVAHSARQQGLSWQSPVVGPNANGGINLEWGAGDRQLFTATRSGQPHTVECVIEGAGTKPRRESASVWDAVDHVLWALGSN